MLFSYSKYCCTIIGIAGCILLLILLILDADYIAAGFAIVARTVQIIRPMCFQKKCFCENKTLFHGENIFGFSKDPISCINPS